MSGAANSSSFRALILLAVASITACRAGPTQDRSSPTAGLRLNQIQVVGSHNSYKQAISPALLEYYQKRRPEVAESLDYWHPRLSSQLSLGLRKLELDVFHDPDGGRYANPSGLGWAPETGAFSPAAFDLSGSLDSPRRDLRTSDLEAYLAARLGGSVLRKLLPDSLTTDAPTEGDAVETLLKGLLKRLGD